MRLLLNLKSIASRHLTYNYNYALSSAIYKFLQLGSPRFSAFLHDIGFKTDGKTYKLFSFALTFENAKYLPGNIEMISPAATLYISSPLIEEFIKNFVIGSFQNQLLIIHSHKTETIFRINQIESLPEPKFSNHMNFRLLSPIVLSTVRDNDEGRYQYYLRPGDIDDINRVLSSNLCNKYKLIHNKEIFNTEITLKWDEEYLTKHERVTKKVTINEDGKNPVDVVGIMAPFSLTGSHELIKTGYDCGFGEKNSMGFGLAVTDPAM